MGANGFGNFGIDEELSRHDTNVLDMPLTSGIDVNRGFLWETFSWTDHLSPV